MPKAIIKDKVSNILIAPPPPFGRVTICMSSSTLYIFFKTPSINNNKITLKYKKLELIFTYVIIKKTKKGDNWEK